MAEDINVLMEQCEEKSQVLLTDANQALDEVDQIVELANNLADELTTANDEAQVSWAAIITELEVAAESLDTEMETTRENLTAFQEKIAEVGEGIGEAMDRFKTRLEEVKSRKEEIFSQTEEQSDNTKSGLDDFTQNISNFVDKVIEHQETANGNIEEHNNVLDAATESFDEKKANLIEQFEALEAELQDKLETMAEDFSQVAEDSKTKEESLIDNLESLASDVATKMTSKFAEDVLQELTGDSELVTEAFSALDTVGEDMKELLDGDIGEIINKVGEVTGLVDEVKPVLELAKSLLA